MPDGSARPVLPGWPLLLRREMAAAYLGLSPSLFDAGVKGGTLPGPIPLVGSVKAWHRGDLDAWAADRRDHAATEPLSPEGDWEGA